MLQLRLRHQILGRTTNFLIPYEISMRFVDVTRTSVESRTINNFSTSGPWPVLAVYARCAWNLKEILDALECSNEVAYNVYDQQARLSVREKAVLLFTAKPVLRYPAPLSRYQQPGIRTHKSNTTNRGVVDHESSKRPPSCVYHSITKPPTMILLEITYANKKHSADMKRVETGDFEKKESFFFEKSYVAVFATGAVVSFGLNDEGVDLLCRDVLSKCKEPKDPMLVPDEIAVGMYNMRNRGGDLRRSPSSVKPTNWTVPPKENSNKSTFGEVASTGSLPEERNCWRSKLPLPHLPPLISKLSEKSHMRNAKNQEQYGETASKIAKEFLNTGECDKSLTHVVLRHQFTTVDDLPRLGYSLPPGGVVSSSYIDISDLDAVVLSGNNPDALLPFIFCFYELLHLKALNALLLPIHKKVVAWQRHIIKKGTLPMTLKDARVLKARLSRLSSCQAKMATDRHKILWQEQHAQSRMLFLAATEYFEVAAVNDEFRGRADGLQESLAYLCDQAHQEKDYHLEYIIIVLIMVEVYLAYSTH
eukprot:Tbor_TRINITY_DN5442_c1_g15::TRINITY_DN5442_c1_g15_i1::g.25139::m.25139